MELAVVAATGGGGEYYNGNAVVLKEGMLLMLQPMTTEGYQVCYKWDSDSCT